MGKKYIFSGGPGVGKTSLLNALSHYFPIVPESWTLYYKTMKKDNFNFHSQSSEFRLELNNLQLSLEEKVSKEQIAFLDRSVLDIIGFAEFYKIPQPIYKIPNDYEKIVFFPQPLPKNLYMKGNFCTYEESCGIDVYLREFYSSSGYKVVEVPFDTIPNRIKFVCEYIKEYL